MIKGIVLVFMVFMVIMVILANSIGHAMGLGYPWKSQKPGKNDLPYICTLPAETGPYQPFATIIRYFYNYETNQCEIFYYSGYEGNANRFNTLEECQQCCPSVNSKSCPTVNATICQLPVNSIGQKCLGDTEFTECGTPCPLICGETPSEACILSCDVGVCQCPPDFYLRGSDCSCFESKESCDIPESEWWVPNGPSLGPYKPWARNQPKRVVG